MNECRHTKERHTMSGKTIEIKIENGFNIFLKFARCQMVTYRSNEMATNVNTDAATVTLPMKLFTEQ